MLLVNGDNSGMLGSLVDPVFLVVPLVLLGLQLAGS